MLERKNQTCSKWLDNTWYGGQKQTQLFLEIFDCHLVSLGPKSFSTHCFKLQSCVMIWFLQKLCARYNLRVFREVLFNYIFFLNSMVNPLLYISYLMLSSSDLVNLANILFSSVPPNYTPELQWSKISYNVSLFHYSFCMRKYWVTAVLWRPSPLRGPTWLNTALPSRRCSSCSVDTTTSKTRPRYQQSKQHMVSFAGILKINECFYHLSLIFFHIF